MVKNDVMSTEEMMGKANLALADMGRAAAGLVPHMQAMGRIINRMDYLMREQVAYFNLQWISNATQEEIRDHLRHWTGSIFDLLHFYTNWDCFPSELKERYEVDSLGRAILMQSMCDMKVNIDWARWKLPDHLFWDKSPRLIQGVLLLAFLALLFLEHF